MSTTLLTGFPGFLGSALLPRLLEQGERDRIVCLVQRHWLDRARAELDDITEVHPEATDRVSLAEGDVTDETLALAPGRLEPEEVSEIFHLAALYDLSADPMLADRINVDGTRNIVDFARGCRALQGLHYVSTCYVSGKHPGVFREADLRKGQSFHNAYEETKYHAEVLVHRAMEDLPATVYRPSIVVGDRTTGETQKYDGPYYLIRFLLRQGERPLVPVFGDPSDHEVNLVPRDFVVDALARIAALDGVEGRTFHLCDLDPPTVDEVLGLLETTLEVELRRIPLPLGLARFATRWVPGIERWTGIPARALDYFVHPASYRRPETTEVLEQVGVETPALESYLDRLVEFVREHPELPDSPMV